MIYKDFRKSIFNKKRYFFSAVVVPLVLGGTLIWAMATKNAVVMGHIVTSMFTLVGWHYVKQVFGFVIVSSAQRKIYYQAWERRLLLMNLITVWFMSSLATHTSPTPFDFYGIKHFGLGLSPQTLTLTYWVVGFSFLATGFMQVQKYIREGAIPAPPAVAAYLALYAWYLPTTSHPAFSYLIPFFHSLQYLTFVWLMKRNQIRFDLRSLKDQPGVPLG